MQNRNTQDDSFYDAMRLILPGLDRERGNYGLKEDKLGERLMAAYAIEKKSDLAARLKNWKRSVHQSD